MDQAHDSVVWSISWHPLGHILASGSNDHTVKFFTRNRLGDKMIDKYNLNLMPKGQEGDDEEMLNEFDDNVDCAAIPGLGLEEMSNQLEQQQAIQQQIMQQQQQTQRKVPFSKKIPRQFENQWSDSNHHHHSHGGNKNKRTKINHQNNARYHNND